MKNYNELVGYIWETYELYAPKIAWGYNMGYLDSFADNSNIFTHGELSRLITLNEEIKKEELSVL